VYRRLSGGDGGTGAGADSSSRCARSRSRKVAFALPILDMGAVGGAAGTGEVRALKGVEEVPVRPALKGPLLNVWFGPVGSTWTRSGRLVYVGVWVRSWPRSRSRSR